jgi:hypothetical protein
LPEGERLRRSRGGKRFHFVPRTYATHDVHLSTKPWLVPEGCMHLHLHVGIGLGAVCFLSWDETRFDTAHITTSSPSASSRPSFYPRPIELCSSRGRMTPSAGLGCAGLGRAGGWSCCPNQLRKSSSFLIYSSSSTGQFSFLRFAELDSEGWV